MTDTALCMLPDALFKSTATLAVLASMIYRKRKGKWPWE